MRYIVFFFDGTTKRIPQEAAPAFMEAMRTKDVVFYRGSSYSGSGISKVKTLYSFYEDKTLEAEQDGKFFCKYGCLHDSKLDCGCRDAKKEKMLSQEEVEILRLPPEKRPNSLPKPQNDKLLAMSE